MLPLPHTTCARKFLQLIRFANHTYKNPYKSCMSLTPLAEHMRPNLLNEMVGHEALLTKDGLLASLLANK